MRTNQKQTQIRKDVSGEREPVRGKIAKRVGGCNNRRNEVLRRREMLIGRHHVSSFPRDLILYSVSNEVQSRRSGETFIWGLIAADTVNFT